MSRHYRLLSCVALLAGALAALGQYRPPWAAGMNLDWWSLPELREEVRRGKEDRAALERAGVAVVTRREAKERATQELLAGRLSLAQAAARFREADALPGGCPRRCRAPGRTEEERSCREVIGWAVAAAERAGGPGIGRAIRRRLEAELNAHLAHGRR
ncbi:MAG TPA: hypothetical protein VFW33_04840 [Gemmataceae bacterium]|nr:hypothetical protein [Gemmataceae bacterium]